MAEPIVYIVDDDPSIRRALKRVIRAAGLDVEAFPSAERFLEYRRSGTPSCLVLDLRMEGMSGRELKRSLDGSAESIPIIFMSAHEEDLAAARKEEKDAVACLGKPFSARIFLKTVSSALGIIPDLI
jgi:FixJ family two-component response regulator